jgi:hypothetical protein
MFRAKAKRTALVLLGAVIAVGTGLVATGCEDSPTSASSRGWIVSGDLGGADTTKTCEVPVNFIYLEWGYNRHLDSVAANRLNPAKPDSCWEYADAGTFPVEVAFKYVDGHGAGYYSLNLHDPGTHSCHQDELEDTLTFVERLAVQSTDGAGDWYDFEVETVTIPSGAECAMVGINWSGSETPIKKVNYDVLLRVWTKLSNPSSLTYDGINGDTVKISWTNGESVHTEVHRRTLPSGSWVLIDSVNADVNSYGDTDWDYSTGYRYRVRHTSTPTNMSTTRLSALTDSVSTGTLPAALTVILVGPDEVQPDAECAWVSTASGGTIPYTHEWTGIATYTGQILSTSFGRGEEGWLYLDVEDDNGWTAEDSLYVDVDPGAPQCTQRSGGG